jgi:hypothetical protein
MIPKSILVKRQRAESISLTITKGCITKPPRLPLTGRDTPFFSSSLLQESGSPVRWKTDCVFVECFLELVEELSTENLGEDLLDR